MDRFIKKYKTENIIQIALDNSELSKPYIAYVINDDIIDWNSKKKDYSKDYLTFIAIEDGTFSFSGTSTANTLSYSIDNGATWIALANGANTPTINQGKSIMWKGTPTPLSTKGIGTFISTGKYNVVGNIMSILFGDNYKNQVNLSSKSYAYMRLFIHSKIVNAENLILPATTLVTNCYNYMFYGCTSLKTAPNLPATRVGYKSYSSMFGDCTSLKTAPELPATTLEYESYSLMFNGCTGLTTAPELPATTLANNCYNYMFQGCTSLNYIKCLATNVTSTYYTSNWVNNVSSTGTFIKAPNATWSTGTSGIPTGWTVQDA